MLKRVVILVMTVLVSAGISAQMMTHAMAVAPAMLIATPCDMAGMDHGVTPSQDMPCKGDIPVCIGSLGCAAAVDIPASASADFVAVDWGQIIWTANALTLAGRTIPPELFPPIFSS